MGRRASDIPFTPGANSAVNNTLSNGESKGLLDDDNPSENHAQSNAEARSVKSSLASQPCLQNVEFLGNLRNPKNLQPVSLPLQLKLFSRVPVVMSARLFGQTGKPSEIYARLLVT